MNHKTMAFLTQFAALCDAHGMTFTTDAADGKRFADDGQNLWGVVFSPSASTSHTCVVMVTDLDDLKAQLAQAWRKALPD